MRTITTILLLLIATLTCHAQVKFVLTSNTNYKAIDYNKVIIYLSEDKVPENAEEIGIVLCEHDKIAKAMIKAKKKASDYGANGLYMKTGQDNDILTSRRKNEHEKELNAKENEDYKSTITFVAIRVPEVVDTALNTHAKASDFSIDEVVYFIESGAVKKGTIVGKNETTAIINRHGGKREVPYSKITKLEK